VCKTREMMYFVFSLSFQGSFMHRNQVYDGIVGPGEESGGLKQLRRKMMGLLEQFELIPTPGSPLWKCDDVEVSNNSNVCACVLYAN
jgi:hypothetical protein